MAKLIGERELMKQFAAMPQKLTGRTLDTALTTALEPMREQTSYNARKLRQPNTNPKGGHLDEGVVTAKKEGRGLYYRMFWVTFARRARKIAHLVEFGTAPHWQPRRFGGWMHPGARPKPFFRPAFEGTKKEVIMTFGRFVWSGIRQVASNAARGRRR